MKNNATLIDAFSTIHVGNGALLDNSYKLAKEYLSAQKIYIVTSDPETNTGRYNSTIEDIFSSYPTTTAGKALWAAWYFINCSLALTYTLLKIPHKHWKLSKKFKKVFDAINDSEYIISMSGETINDHFAPQMYMRSFLFYICIKLEKKLCIFPQSIGPIFRKRSEKLLKFFLKDSHVVLARDEASLQLSNKVWKDCNTKVLYCPDVAVTQESIPASNWSDSEKKLIGITLSNPPGEIKANSDFVDRTISALSGCTSPTTHSLLLMPSNYKKNGTSKDYEICTYAKNRFNQLGYTVNILPNKAIHPDEYQAIQKNLFAFISSRMHVGILATSAGTPTIMINTQHKIRGYMQNIEMERFVLEYDEIERRLPDLINICELENQSIRNELARQNELMRSKLHRTFKEAFSLKTPTK